MKHTGIAVLLALSLNACSLNAEKDRAEDISLIRGSYTVVSSVAKILTGGTVVCQMTVLDEDGELLERHTMYLDETGCRIGPVDSLPAAVDVEE